MNRQTNEILIDYLDNRLSPEEKSRIEHLIQQDDVMATELQYLKLAMDTVRLNSIGEKVAAERKSVETIQNRQHSAGKALVRNMYTKTLRIAAILVILLGSAILYKYLSVTNRSMFEKQFTPYDLSNTRGAEIRDAESEAYRNKNWNEVISDFNLENRKTNKSRFLAAMAQMQLNQFREAEGIFEDILNHQQEDNSFREETEYYLSLAYMMDHQVNKSMALLNKIKGDTSHTYYPLASRISDIDLKIIQLKK
jgi:hypothetical protein